MRSPPLTGEAILSCAPAFGGQCPPRACQPPERSSRAPHRDSTAPRGITEHLGQQIGAGNLRYVRPRHPRREGRRSIPIVVLPFVNSALASRAAFRPERRNASQRRRAYPPRPWRVRAAAPRTGTFPWHLALDQACRLVDARPRLGRRQEACGMSLVMPSLVTRAAIHRTRSWVVMLGGMSMTRCPTVAHVERTTRSAAVWRSSTLAR